MTHFSENNGPVASAVSGNPMVPLDNCRIVTKVGDPAVAEAFAADIDSAIVMVNATTQFADEREFGFGAEIGIATGQLHARGPVGAEQLTTFKDVVRGSAQVRG